MQAHLGLFMSAWILFGCAWTILTSFMDYKNVFRDFEQAYLIDDDPLMFFFWFVPVVAWLFLDAVLLWKGVSATRHANR
jgi:uncharacterized membrane protein